MQSSPPSDSVLDGCLRLIVESYRRLTGKSLIVDDLLLPPCRGKDGMGVEFANPYVSTPSLTTPARRTPVGAPPLCGDPSAVPLHGGGDVVAALREAVWNAPRAIVAHGIEDDPIFFYGNRIALQLFEMDFAEFARLPSRLSAEPQAQETRVKLLEKVTRQGYVDDYSGIRIAKSGRSFMIMDATVWNLVDESGIYHGQAAVFFAQ